MNEPRVIIIIVTFNKKDYVVNLLNSLKTLNYTNYDIVVVDNASVDETVEYLEKHFTYLTIIKNSDNKGGSGGFNTGLAYAFERSEYKYYWLLDNDVVVSDDSLRNLVNVLEQYDDIAVAGSQMCQLDNPEVTNEIGAYVDLYKGHLILNRHLTRKSNNSKGIFEVDYVAAASMLVRADIAKKIGLWEDYFIHFDDVEWCLRIKKMGYRIVGVADSVIWHLSAAEKPITWQQYYDVRNMLYLLDKHASKKDVARFARRKCLQAIYTELRGLTPVAEIIIEAIEDFSKNKKGVKKFNFPQNINEDALKKTHPAKEVLVCQNEWFDVKKFPFESEYKESIKEMLLPPYLIDAFWYWRKDSNISILKKNKLTTLIYLICGLLGYRRYKRSYVDIRSMPFLAAFLSEELVVKINEMNWIIKRDKKSLWKSLFSITPRSLRHYIRFFLNSF